MTKVTPNGPPPPQLQRFLAQAQRSTGGGGDERMEVMTDGAGLRVEGHGADRQDGAARPGPEGFKVDHDVARNGHVMGVGSQGGGHGSTPASISSPIEMLKSLAMSRTE